MFFLVVDDEEVDDKEDTRSSTRTVKRQNKPSPKRFVYGTYVSLQEV